METPQFVELDDNDSDKMPSFRCWEASNPENEIPKGALKVVGSSVINPETKFYMIVVEQADGQKIQMPVYKRDYRRCTKEWGKNPSQWQLVRVIRDGTRFALAPLEQQPIKVEDII